MLTKVIKSEKEEEREASEKAGTGGLSRDQANHWLRFFAGVLGILLPVVLVLGEWKLLNATEWEARGSLSEYYHSGMRDFFVGVLVIIGIVLITYKIPEWRSAPTFWLSAAAGIGAIAVAAFPTGIPCELREVSPNPCELRASTEIWCNISDELPKGCTAREHVDLPPQDKVRPTALQNRLTEEGAAEYHKLSTGLFLGPLLVLCVIFAIQELQERKFTEIAHWGLLFAFHMLMALFMVAGGLYILFRRDVDPHAVYWGELMATLGFGLSWLVKGWHREVLFPRRNVPANGGPHS